MASFMLSNSFLVLLLASIAFFSTISTCETSFRFGEYASFASDDIALYVDTKLLDGGYSVQLSHGGGRVVYNKPIDNVHPMYQSPPGFSTAFSFSISPNHSQSLALVVFTANGTLDDDHSLLQVKFDFSDNFTKSRDGNVTVTFDDVTKVKGNFTTITNLEKKKRLVLHVWIVFEPCFNSLKVQLGKSEDSLNNVVESWVGWSKMNNENALVIGLKSYSGNFSLYYWSFEPIPAILRSLVPQDSLEKRENGEAEKRWRREKNWKIVTRIALMFGVMFVWAAFIRNNLSMVMPKEGAVKTKEFECKNMEKKKGSEAKLCVHCSGCVISM